MSATPASTMRRDIARRIAAAYAGNPKVAAVLVAGSGARGDADRFSDVEIGVFWREPPTEDQRREAIERARGDLHRLYPYDSTDEVWGDDWKIGRNEKGEPFSGVSVDMVHMLAESAQRKIDAVVKGFDPDQSKQNLIAAVRMGIALHGEALIERWRGETNEYPDGLVRAVVQRYGQIDHFWRISMWRERGDLTGVHGKIVGVQGAMFSVLMGINRIYWFGVKHRDSLIAKLKIAPGDLGRRLDGCFDPDHALGEQTLRLLVEEMYDLVEREVAGVDVQRLRRIFRYRRPLWDGELPGLD